MNKSEWLMRNDPNHRAAVEEKLTAIARARGILEYCATNEAAHFGGRHGMFVDVPVDALKELLNAHKDATE